MWEKWTHSLKHNNPLGEFSELRSRLEKNDEYLDLFATVKFGLMRINLDDCDYILGASRAYLAIQTSGLEISMGTVLGEAPFEPWVETEEHSKVSQKSGSIGASVRASDVGSSANLDGSAEAGTTGSRKKSLKRETKKLPVKSLPGNRWEISDADISGNKRQMEGTALSNEMICKLVEESKSNQASLSLDLYVRKIDLVVTAEGNKLARRFKLLKNKEAVIGLVAQKALRREIAREDFGQNEKTMVVSRTEVDIE